MLNSYFPGVGPAAGPPSASPSAIWRSSSPARWSARPARILSYIMCKGMNRFLHLGHSGRFGGERRRPPITGIERKRQLGSADDAAFLMQNGDQGLILPATAWPSPRPARAAKLPTSSRKAGARSNTRIHPGRRSQPANERAARRSQRSLDEGVELEDINAEFAQADIGLMYRRNGRHQPSARDDKPRPSTVCRPRRRQGPRPASSSSARSAPAMPRSTTPVLQGRHHDACSARQEDDRRHRQGDGHDHLIFYRSPAIAGAFCLSVVA